MTAVQPSLGGPRRRLTPEQEQRAAQLFAAGKTERQVAAALHVGRGTANRLRHRLDAVEGGEGASIDAPAAAPDPDGGEGAARDAAPGGAIQPPDGGQDPPDVTGTEDEAEAAESLSALRAEAERLTAQHQALLEQAQAARERVEDIDGKRLEAIGSGGDTARFASQRAQLEADHARLTGDASVVAGWLAGCEADIARREARGQLAVRRRELAAAVKARQAVYAKSGPRQRAAVLAVAAAAADFTAVPADEAAADGKVTEAHHAVAALCRELGEAADPAPAQPPSAQLGIMPAESRSGPGLSLLRALNMARAGNAALVARELGWTFGWLPPLREEREATAGPQVAGVAVGGPQPGRAPDQPPWIPHTVGLDERGNPVVPPDPRLEWVPMPPHRHPSGIPFYPR
jgi:hypothetical protein